MPLSEVITICVTVLIASITLMAQAVNGYVKATDLVGLRHRISRLEEQAPDFAVMRNEISNIRSLLTDIKEALKNKQDKDGT